MTHTPDPYNPNNPQIVGLEWVGIRDEDIVFIASENFTEIGHQFTLDTATQIGSGRAYIHDITTPLARYFNMSVYPQGSEALTGPIQRCVIPVNAGAVTGGTLNTHYRYSGASNLTDALNKENSTSIIFEYYSSGPAQRFHAYFATNQYSFLQNKRIVGVNLLISAAGYHDNGNDPDSAFQTPQGTSTPTLFGQLYRLSSGASSTSGDLISLIDTSGASDINVVRAELGDHFALWSGGTSADSSLMPWKYSDLQRFEFTSSDPVATRMTVQITVDNDVIIIYYMALEVLYCEETRVISGANFGFYDSVNPIALRDVNTRATNPVLPAGDYSLMFSMANPGFSGSVEGGTGVPTFNALRELYAVPEITGKQINVSRTVGAPFTVEDTSILPQLSLHVTGGAPVQGVHAYGRQAIAEVYGTKIATQRIDDNTPGMSAVNYPQVRFYARRWGNTTESLTLYASATPAEIASITPTEFDALTEIIDGWKEVTLRLATPATIGDGTYPAWIWESAAEVAGNRWEILGMTAPAISGISGNIYNQAPSVERLGTATWGSTNAYATWGGYAPPISGVADDNTSDLVVLFSLDPPVVSGFAVSLETQSLTGFAECSGSPCCIPSALSYHRVVWDATATPVTGFGAYELQRMDAVQTEWQTIMLATSPSVTGFSDYEARVGVLSSYRIREVYPLDFYGAWSITGTGTITEPGVTMPSCGTSKRGVLIFTTNEVQDGSSNLAYAMTWEGNVEESFSFVEANNVVVSEFFDRNYSVAFHGAERGGESFSRQLLLANAAVSQPRLANMHSLRDLAWEDLPYVCVRDDIGDRWLATVIVPAGTVRRNRRLYNADVTIIEVTDTASPVALS